MFGMSGTELVIILVLALVLIGPDDLPNAAKTIAKTIRDVRKAGDDLRDTFEREVMTDVRKAIEPPLGTVAKTKEPAAPITSTVVPTSILPPPSPEPKRDETVPDASQGKWAVSASSAAPATSDANKPSGS